MDAELKEILKDFPAGPLSDYRKNASFNWKDMCLLMQGKDALILKVYSNLKIVAIIFLGFTPTHIYFPAQNMVYTRERSCICSSCYQSYS